MSRRITVSLLAAASILVTPVMGGPVGFIVNNLASDQPGVAPFTDPDLVNPWGIGASGSSPFWLGANHTGKSVLYNGAGVKQGLVVTIPGDGSVTGVVFNSASATGSFNGDLFLFDSEDGTVSGWRGALGTNAEVLVLDSIANVYKGLALGTIGANTYAYLANFRAGTIDILKGAAGNPNLTGTFVDPNLPAGYAPFNVQNLGNILYVAYALQDGAKHDDMPGAGLGIVDTFDLNGSFLKRVIGPGGKLNAPWGLALAPSLFGDVGGDLLVGNFGDGLINAYNPTSGAFIQTLRDQAGNPISIDGLWALRFGNGGAAGSTNTLYFTAGPSGENHGLFGDLVAAPEPGTWLLAGVSLLLIGLRRRQTRFN